MDPNNTAMLKKGLFWKIKKVTKNFTILTQKERAQLILDLKVLMELAQREATAIPERGKFTKERQKAAQLAAYIARTINIVATQYDNKKVMDELKQLWNVAAQLERERAKREHKRKKRHSTAKKKVSRTPTSG